MELPPPPPSKSALKWPPSPGRFFSSGTKWRPQAGTGGATLVRFFALYGHLEILHLCSPSPLLREWKETGSRGGPRPSSWLSVAGVRADRGAGVVGLGESVAGPRAAAGSDVPAGGEGPAVGAGPAKAQESRSPASRRGGGMLRPRCRRGAVPAWDGKGERKQEFAFFGQLGRGRRGGCQFLGDLWGGRGVRSEAAGGKEDAFLPGEQRAGRWAGGGGLRSSPPRLPPAASRRGCRKHFLAPAWVGGIHCSFVPRKGENGAEVPAAMLLPVSSSCRVPATVHPCPSRIFPDALRAGELKEWTVKKTARQSLVIPYLVRWALRRGSESLGRFPHHVLVLMELRFSVTDLSAQFSK